MTGNKVGVVLSGKPLSAVLEGCEVDRNLGAGVVVEHSAEPRLRGCQITQNGTHGIMVERGGNPTLWHCLMRHNASNGLYICEAQVPPPPLPSQLQFCSEAASDGRRIMQPSSFERWGQRGLTALGGLKGDSGGC